MRNSIAKAAAFSLIAGAMILPAVPASAATTNASSVAVKAADEPFAAFSVKVKAPKTAKAGGKLNYVVTGVNKGPYSADAWFVGGEFPKGVDLRKVRYRTSVPGTECSLDGRALFCLLPTVLEKGDAFTMVFETRLKKNAKGVQKAILGVASFDVQQGMEGLDKEELERIGVPSHAYAKLVKTKVVR
ncbi:hypothetical protein OIE66_38660 [Nonomuraea sp. NBC_01738]|uniref:hypothetical protein n=1 Tax=Nonomuraea sp. NBC_01738 TaxID=2976003 RepID=UPI002E11374B|nr:hypothetical protein OIE66_38660 [Nonomuraea sp. NBC_01738]